MTITDTQRAELVRMITHLLAREFKVGFEDVSKAVLSDSNDNVCTVSTETGCGLYDPFFDSPSHASWMRVQDELAAYQQRNGMSYTAYWDSINPALHVFYATETADYHPYHTEES